MMVELDELGMAWEAARNGGKGGNNEPIGDHEIDVVGDDDSDSEEASGDGSKVEERSSPLLSSAPLMLGHQDEEQQQAQDLSETNSQTKPINAFSIDNLLASRYRSLDSKAGIKVENVQYQ
jgi:hypothetical protein